MGSYTSPFSQHAPRAAAVAAAEEVAGPALYCVAQYCGPQYDDVAVVLGVLVHAPLETINHVARHMAARSIVSLTASVSVCYTLGRRRRRKGR